LYWLRNLLLREELITDHCKHVTCCEMLEKALGLDILWNEQKMDEIWNLDCEESLYIWVTEVSYKRIFNFIQFISLSLYHYNYYDKPFFT
jgi:hypothetical protein